MFEKEATSGMKPLPHDQKHQYTAPSVPQSQALSADESHTPSASALLSYTVPSEGPVRSSLVDATYDAGSHRLEETHPRRSSLSLDRSQPSEANAAEAVLCHDAQLDTARLSSSTHKMAKRSHDEREGGDQHCDDPSNSGDGDNEDDLTKLNQDRRKRLRARIISETSVSTSDVLRLDQKIFVPRSYQAELFEVAKRENVLVCLDTGSGKTLISVLLLKHVFEQQSLLAQPGSKRKVSFFLVNLVPLVHQQSSVIAGNTTLSVGKLYGELKDTVRSAQHKGTIDTWRLPEWEALLDSHDVIVSTAQCFLDALIHGFVKMSELSLLIFDEVHHAVKSHPFLRIMKYYRLSARTERPKVFGMTASPIFSINAEFKEAQEYLEGIMDAKVHTASGDSLHELDKVKNRPEELVVEYEANGTASAASRITREMEALFADKYQEWETEVLPKILYALENFGPLVADLVWYSTILELRKKAIKWAQKGDHQKRRALLSAEWISTASQNNADGLGSTSANLSSNAELNQRILLHMKKQPTLPDILELDPTNASNKILGLVQLLRCFSSEAGTFCGIIFVERRQTASILVELIKRIPSLSSFLHPEWIVGHDQSSSSDSSGTGLGMNWHDQVQVLNRFRCRSPTNLLIATSIAEEGLDIQAANVVIRFDLFNRHIGFLQSKGRARAKDSKFIILAEKANAEHERVILNAFNTEDTRARWLDDLSQGLSLKSDGGIELAEWRQKLRIEADDDDIDDGGEEEQSLFEPTTGARLFPVDAPSLISHYVSALPSDEYLKDAVLNYEVVTHQEEHQSFTLGTVKLFTCMLQLPSNSPVREVNSGIWRNKKQAKRMAAFLACKRLRELDELDQWLMPKLFLPPKRQHPEQGGQNPHYRITKVYGRPIHVPDPPMDGWHRFLDESNKHEGRKEEEGWYGTYLPLHEFDANCKPVMLLTRKPLPETQLLSLHQGGGTFKNLRPKHVGRLSPFSEPQLEAIRRVSAQVFGLVCRNGPVQDTSALLVVPVHAPSADSDEYVFDIPTQTRPLPIDVDSPAGLTDALFVRQDGPPSDTIYRFIRTRHDMTPYSIDPASIQKEKENSTQQQQQPKTVLERVCRMYGSKEHPGWLRLDLVDGQQPLVQVEKLPPFTNLLTTTSSQHPVRSSLKTTKSKTRYLIPQFHRMLPFSHAVFCSASLLPSILVRYDQLLLASTCNRLLLSNRLDLDLLTTALSAPALRTTIDYERFEFLGDTFLKFAATNHTFTTLQAQNEAELHLANRDILSNERLLEEALRLGVWRFAKFQYSRLNPKKFKLPTSSTGQSQEEEENDDDAGLKVVKTSKAIFVGRVTADTCLGEKCIIREKTLSDMMEAMIGVGLLTSGPEGGLFVCSRFNLIPSRITSMESFNLQLSTLKQQAMVDDWRSRVSLSVLEHLERIFEYKFKYPHLALEAFTHPSLLASVLPSYQRLEFLGDAWIDFFAVNYLYETYPTLGPGELTVLKGYLCSNSTLSALGVEMGLHGFIASHSQVLASQIEEYTTSVQRLKADHDTRQDPLQRGGEGRGGGKMYWNSIKRPPKSIADVVESSFAAIVVDSGFQVQTAQNVFDKWFIPFYKRYCRLEDMLVDEMKALVTFLGARFGSGRCCQLRLETNLVLDEAETLLIPGEEATREDVAGEDEESGTSKKVQDDDNDEAMTVEESDVVAADDAVKVDEEKLLAQLLSEIRVDVMLHGIIVARLVTLPKNLAQLQAVKILAGQLKAVLSQNSGQILQRETDVEEDSTGTSPHVVFETTSVSPDSSDPERNSSSGSKPTSPPTSAPTTATVSVGSSSLPPPELDRKGDLQPLLKKFVTLLHWKKTFQTLDGPDVQEIVFDDDDNQHKTESVRGDMPGGFTLADLSRLCNCPK